MILKQNLCPSSRAFLTVILFLGLGSTGFTHAQSKSQAPFARIVAEDASEYAAYQVKFTWTGPQFSSKPTLLFVGENRTPDIGEFHPYRTPDIHYGNDETRAIVLMVSGSTIKALVEAMGNDPDLQIPSGPLSQVLSVMIERGTPPQEVVFERLNDRIDGHRLLNILEIAVRGEPARTRDLVWRFHNTTVGLVR